MTQGKKELPGTNPFQRGSWHGRIWTLDGASTADFTLADLDEVLYAGDTGGPQSWDGQVAGIARLKDGRYVSWEAYYGPTGDGFSEDAYGGDADILVSKTLQAAAMLGLTGQGRDLVGWVEGQLPDSERLRPDPTPRCEGPGPDADMDVRGMP